MKRADAIKIRRMIDRAAAMLPDNAAAECPDLFPTFDSVLGQKLPAGFKLQDGGILYAVIHDYLKEVDVELIPEYERSLYERLDGQHDAMLAAIRETGELSKDSEAELREALKAFTGDFLQLHAKE